MDGTSSQYSVLPLDHEKASTSHPWANVNVPAIFLSHSGRQKNFVDDLFIALTSANHTVFFDKHSLPKGSTFPNHIKEAALNCRLGVVILSEDFFISKWPMLELEMLVLYKGPNTKVFPVCYKLNFEDLKSSSNISRWRLEWEKIEDGKHVDQWEKAVRALARFNGEIYPPGTSKNSLIKKVVHQICNLVPCPIPYDMSLIQGHHRLAKEIASMFDHVKARCSEESTCMVGLHGVGGLGKTTLCRSVVSYYRSQYHGRSCLIEFPSDGDHKSKIVDECKSALGKLTNLNELVLARVKSFEEVIPLMRDHVKKEDVFLAIDSVWDSSLEEAKRLLRVGFSANSKALLTSRSEKVLKDLLMQHANNIDCVYPLPTPEHEEAFQIFQDTFDAGNLRSLLDRDQIDILLERCRFGGNYHPLALKALAQYVKKVCTLDNQENRKHCLPVVLKEIRNADLLTVENVIRLSYDNLLPIKKHMFLDIAIFFNTQVDAKRDLDGTVYSYIHNRMCCYYKELTEPQITTLIGDLASDGLIQIEAGKDRIEKIVSMHDLYRDLAHKEAASSSRFFLPGRSTSSGEKIIEWEKLERVQLYNNNEAMCLFEKVGTKKCEKLHILSIDGVTIRSEMHLDCMPSLRVLHLDSVALNRSEEQRTSRNTMGLRAAAPGRVIKLNALVELRILRVESCGFVERITGLNALPNLRYLFIIGCPSLKELEGLSGLIRLEELWVEKCESLKTMSGLKTVSGLIRLEELWVRMSGLNRAERPSNSEPKKEEEGRSLSPSLMKVTVKDCGALEKMPDLGGLTCLQELSLWENGALEVEVGGKYLSSTLKLLQIYGCKSVRRFPSLKECVHLETLSASQRIINGQHTENGCLVLNKLPNLNYLDLEDSNWSCTKCFNEQWKHATRLQQLKIDTCHSIKILEVGSLVSSLKLLWVWGCRELEEIGDLSALHCLEELDIKYCPKLKVVGDLMGISAHVKCLTLKGCGSLEESNLTDVSLLKSMQQVSIINCGNLKDWPTPTTQ